MEEKHLKKDEMRLICLNEDALFEFISEMIIENAEEYFDLNDMTTVTFQMMLDRKRNRFVCAILDEVDGRELDLYKAADDIGETTPTMFSERRYVTADASKYVIPK